jgi:hypothetical protein
MESDSYSLTSVFDLSPLPFRTALKLAMLIFMHDTTDGFSLSRRRLGHWSILPRFLKMNVRGPERFPLQSKSIDFPKMSPRWTRSNSAPFGALAMAPNRSAKFAPLRRRKRACGKEALRWSDEPASSRWPASGAPSARAQTVPDRRVRCDNTKGSPSHSPNSLDLSRGTRSEAGLAGVHVAAIGDQDFVDYAARRRAKQ